jgi:hypothetical protein
MNNAQDYAWGAHDFVMGYLPVPGGSVAYHKGYEDQAKEDQAKEDQEERDENQLEFELENQPKG